MESEESWMYGKRLTIWAKLRSDEQKFHMRWSHEDETAVQVKVQYCTDHVGINEADIWSEGCHSYLGRSAGVPDREPVNIVIQ